LTDGAPPNLARRVAKSVLLACIAAAGVLAVVELVLWIWRPFPILAPLYPGDCDVTAAAGPQGVIDDAIGWRFVPRAVIDDPSPDFHVVYHCNSAGFRAVRPRPSDDGALKIVFLGDSFAFGVGVEEEQTFVERIAEARGDVRVVNLGMPGFGVDQMKCTLSAFGAREQPDLVVAVFVVDDLTRSMTAFRDRGGLSPKPTFTLERGVLVPLDQGNSPSAVRRWFGRTFYLAEAWRRVENKYGLDYGFGDRFELNRALFVAMNGSCKALGAELLVVHLPQREAWKPIPAFAGALRARSVRVLDFGEVPVDDATPLYFARDPHLSPAGHRFVAETLLRAFADAEGVLRSHKR
jgi:hypothetical protein